MTKRLSHTEFDKLLLDYNAQERAINASRTQIMEALLRPETNITFCKRIQESGSSTLQSLVGESKHMCALANKDATKNDREAAAEWLLDRLKQMAKESM